MTLNYLKLAFRLMRRNPFFTFVNVVCLGVGIATFFVLQQYSYSELNSDRQWKDWDRVVRCGFIWKWTDDGQTWAQSQFGQIWPEVVAQLPKEFGEIEEMTRIFRQENFSLEHIPFHSKNLYITRINDRGELTSFKETSLVYADPNVFDFFAIPLIEGNSSKALAEANSIVLSKKMAVRYFGNESAVNQTLLINNNIPLKVTGVYDDLPENTHLEFEGVLSTVTIDRYINLTQFAMGGSHSYFRLIKGTDVQQFEDKLNSEENYWLLWGGKHDPKDVSIKGAFYLQALSEVAFGNYRWDYFKPKSKYFLNALGWTGLVTLLISWINYVQLSTSFYMKRLKEIGVRKTSGARLWDFAKQFMVESAVINIVALLFAATVVQLCKPPLSSLFEFNMPPWRDVSTFILAGTGIACVAGAFFSGLLPILLLKVNTSRLLVRQSKKLTVVALAKPLVAVQFAFSIILITWVFTVHKQMDHVLSANYGIDRSAVAMIDLPQKRNTSFQSDLNVLQQSLQSQVGVDLTSFSTITGDADNNMICLKTITADNNACVDTNGGVDENFIPFFGIKLVAGRNFRADVPADSGTIVMSVKAIRRLGIQDAEAAIGKKIYVNTGTWTDEDYKQAEIVGVVEDYLGGKASLLINEGMGDGHAGIILTYKDQFIPISKPQKLAFRIDPSKFGETSEAVERIYKNIFPGELFRFYFLNDQIATFYEGEKTARNQILLFSMIAIGIACLGLLGAISNKVVEKTKEIGIRKVLGAQLHQIAKILLDTTAKQVAIATLIGIPVAYYLTQRYLQKFSEQMQLQWWHYAAPVAVLVAIMVCTVSFVVWKAARSNPVEALKCE